MEARTFLRSAALAWLLLGPTGCDRSRSEGPGPTSDVRSSEPTEAPIASTRGPTSDEAEDAAAVRKLFLDYKNAVYARKGDEAAALVAEPTLTYFEAARKDALFGAEADLRKKSFVDRLMVLMFRVRIDADRLRRSDGKQLFSHGVNEGMVGQDASTLEPAKVVILGDVAKLGFMGGGEEVPPDLGFRAYREKGTWKLDVMSILRHVDPMVQKKFAEIDPDPDVAILRVLETMAGRKLGPEVWKPIDPPRAN